MVRALPLLLLPLAACEGGTITVDDDPLADTDTGAPDDTGDTGEDTGDTGEDTGDTGEDTGTPAEDCIPYGVSALTGVVLDQGGRIDSFDSRLGAYEPGEERASVSANSTAECAIHVRNGAILGDVAIGVGGYPDVAVCVARSARLTGAQEVLGQPVPVDEVVLPQDLPDNGGDKELAWNEEITFRTDRVFDDLSIDTRSKLILQGDLDILVEGDLTVEGGSLIELADGAEVDLYVRGRTLLAWNSRINMQGQDAGRLRLHVLGQEPVQLSQGAEAALRIVAPDAEVIVNAGHLYGTVQADRVQTVWNGRLHVDRRYVCGSPEGT